MPALQLPLLAALLALAASPALAVVKCVGADGKISYQQAVCPNSAQPQPMHNFPRPRIVTIDPATLSMEKDPSPTLTPSPADLPAPVPMGAGRSGLEPEADICLEYLKPLLKDPGSPYYRNLQKEGTVLSMELYAKNALGGYTSKPAACEIKNGRLDDGWTRIHLKRLGWAVQ